MSQPYISICIPAYKRPHYLERLLLSISRQSFKDFEVVIADDSGADTSVEALAQKYSSEFKVNYHRNSIQQGSPGNWKAAVLPAKGQWIKIMHDDDWFYDDHALGRFVEETAGPVKVIFCGYREYHETTQHYKDIVLSSKGFKDIQRVPYNLFIKNVLGPPSAFMYHSSLTDFFELKLKWVVDFEYFIRLLQTEPCAYISDALVCFSVSESQVSFGCINNPEVELPEALFLSTRYGSKLTSNMGLYDAWWRLIRNLDIHSVADANRYRGQYDLPPFLVQIINRQKKIPQRLLRYGLFSKVNMALSYLTASLHSK